MHPMRIAVEQQGDQHVRVEPRTPPVGLGPRPAGVERRGVHRGHHIDQEPGQMVLGQPLRHQRRQQKRLITVNRPIRSRHKRDPRPPRSRIPRTPHPILQQALEGTGVTATVLHPGVVRTTFAAEDPSLVYKALMPLARLVMKTPEQGAATSTYLASSPEVEGVTGRYFANRKPKQSSKASYDAHAAARLWQVSADLVGLGSTRPPREDGTSERG